MTTFDSLFDKQTIKGILNRKVQEEIDAHKIRLAGAIFEGVDVRDTDNVYEGDDLSLCEHCEIETDETDEELQEQRIVYRVTSAGKRIKRIKCSPGMRVVTVNGIKKCVATTGVQKAHKRIGTIKALRTKRSKGNAYKAKTIRKQKKAIKKRKAMGLNVGRKKH